MCVSGISTWNQSLADDIALYEDLGVHTIGAALRKIEGETDVELLRSSGLEFANVIGVGHAGLTRGVDMANRLGAPAIVFTTGPPGRWSGTTPPTRLPPRWSRICPRPCSSASSTPTRCGTT